MPVVDLDEMVDRFIDEAIQRQREECAPQDELVRAAITDNAMPLEERADHVRTWLRDYQVLQGFTIDDRLGVSNAILRYAQNYQGRPLGKDAVTIEAEFNTLYALCADAVHLNRDGRQRNVTSLASKALWACHPNSVPMFDELAANTLGVLTRLEQLELPQNSTTYGRFLGAWFAFYERTNIQGRDLNGYPYPIRVFDKILWIVGQEIF